jgi:hypothetical protein
VLAEAVAVVTLTAVVLVLVLVVQVAVVLVQGLTQQAETVRQIQAVAAAVAGVTQVRTAEMVVQEL